MAQKDDILGVSVAQKVLKSVLDRYDLDVAQLGRLCNVGSSTIFYDINKGKTQTISKRTADMLKVVFPELRIKWLVTGQGEMIDADYVAQQAQEQEKAPTEVHQDIQQVLLHLVSVIETQTQTISELNKNVSALTLQVASMQPQPVRPYLFNENESSAFAADDSNTGNK